MATFDQYLIDSTGAFLQGELEVIDQTLHLPLNTVTWHRDMLLRTDVSIADDWASFTNSTYASTGGTNPLGKSWGGKRSNATPSVELDIQKTTGQLFVWEKAVDWTIWELESASKLGRPVDVQKVVALQTLWNQEVDNQVYLGDSDLGVYGLFNNPVITNTTNATTGTWATATPAQILADVRELEQSVWATSGWAAAPTKLLLDPVSFAALLQPLTIGGVAFTSIREYIARNSVCMAVNSRELDIQPVKWAKAGYAHATLNSMVAYTPDYDKVRMPLTTLAHSPIEFRGTYQLTTYYSKIGSVEIVYPSTIGIRRGI